MRTYFLIWLVCGVIAGESPSTGTAAGNGTQPPDEQTCRASLEARLRSLQNIVVEYKMRDEYWPSAEAVAQVEAMNKAGGKYHTEISQGVSNHVGKFRYLDGRLWLESHLPEESLAISRPSEFKDEIDSFYEGGFERYTLPIEPFKGLGMGGRYKEPRMLLQDEIDLGFGVRMLDGQKWLTLDDLKDMTIEIVSATEINARKKDEFYRRQHVWRFDPQNGYAMTSYSVIRDGFEAMILCKDFHAVEGVALPNQIDIRRFANREGKRQPVVEHSYSVSAYQLNSPDNTLQSFHITFPVNTAVLDEKTGDKVILKTKPLTFDDRTPPEAEQPQDQNRKERIGLREE